MKTSWKGLAIAGIWIGVGMSSYPCGLGAIFISAFAWLATGAIANGD